MPGTVNGIGNAYYGKGRVISREATCEFCGYEGNLLSYDTMSYFVILFVPILPLGKKHIFDYCPSCSRHRVISYGKWEKIKKNAMAEVQEAVRAGNADETFLLEKLPAFASYQDPEPFRAVAASLLEKGNLTAPIYALLGQLFHYHHANEEAIICYKKAQQMDNSLEHRELLAEAYIHAKQPENAEPLLGHVIDTAPEESFWLGALLVEGYMVTGNHTKANLFLTKMVKVYTDEKYIAAINSLTQAGAPYQGTSEIYYSPRIETQHGPFFTGKEKLNLKPMLVGPAIALGLFILMIVVSYGEQFDRLVKLVNGTDKIYTVIINGKDYKVAPFDHRTIRLDEGRYEITFPDSSLAFLNDSITLKTSFFSRPFSDTRFVINPDKQAILFKGDILYTTDEYATGPHKNPYTYYGGKNLYSFNNIDYSFTTPPAEISMSGTSEMKHSLGMLSEWDPKWTSLDGALQHLEPEAFQVFIHSLVRTNPENEKALYTYSAFNSIEDMIAFLKPELDRIPVNVQYHRFYQNLLLGSDTTNSLVEEYRNRSQRYPDNSDLLYLLGRTLNGAEAEAIYRQAIAAKDPSPYAFNALAWEYITKGNFTKALKMVNKAVELQPKNPTFVSHRKDVLNALKKYDTLLEITEKELKASPTDYTLWGDKVSYMSLLNKKKTIPAEIDGYIAQLREEGAPDLQSYRDYLNMRIAIAEKNSKSCFESCEKLDNYKVYPALYSRNFSAADSIAEENRSSSLDLNLVLYSLALKEGKGTEADKFLTEAIASLETGSRDNKLAAKALKGEQVSTSEIINLAIYPDTKAAILTALGVQNRALRSTLFLEAQQYNFIMSPLQLILNDIIR